MLGERPGAAPDYERRSLWLAVVTGLVLVLRGGPSSGFVYDPDDLQVWLFVASVVAFGLCVVLCLLAVVPEFRSRFRRPALREQPSLFKWAFVLFALGLVITCVAYVEASISSLDNPSPFESGLS
jgi:drug/metabolite transporter (DMT)-like permease